MNYVKKIFLLLITALGSAVVFAQDKKPEMADIMRSNGKIYIVMAVCLTILIGLFFYVFILDRKISAFERSSKD